MQETLSAKRKKNKPLLQATPRRTMQKFIAFIQRCLDVCGVEPGLRFFLADKLLEVHGVLDALKSGDFSAVDIPAFLSAPCPPTLTICSDQEQTQIGGMNSM